MLEHAYTLDSGDCEALLKEYDQIEELRAAACHEPELPRSICLTKDFMRRYYRFYEPVRDFRHAVEDTTEGCELVAEALELHEAIIAHILDAIQL